jgi:hypothetical protein
MAESPLVRLGRLLGGVVLMQGRLGHQVLGQLLVLNSTEVELAGASVVVAATTGQRSAAAQMALRTVAPAAAVHVLARREEKRLDRLARILVARRQELADRERQLGQRDAELATARGELEARALAAEARLHEAGERIAALEQQGRQLEKQLEQRRSTRPKKGPPPNR